METFLTRAMTIVALTCILVVGAAAASILGRDAIPTARQQAIASGAPVSNKEGKKDKLAVAALVVAAYEAPQSDARLPPPAQEQFPELAASLRRAYASIAPADTGLPSAIEKPVEPGTHDSRTSESRTSDSRALDAVTVTAPAAPKPKAAKPQPQKHYALLSDAQIAGIKQRLKLTASQEYYWPAVETALRAVARKIHAKRQSDPNANGMPIDPDSEEVQQLKSAAMPLLFQLREDQKNEVRQLARIIGLDKVAAMI